ncbi:Uncharacterised protein [BD1-7 clade bacterium]|nr:Uncharacterised protein [BD1-7 clade bacterium]
MELDALKHLQSEMLGHILDQPNDAPSLIVDEGALNAKQRLSIYHSAYRMRLKETIETDHEVLGSYLGDDLFDQMVIGYLQYHRSDNPSLRYFCDPLPKFLASHAPFSDLPVISELARFERLLLVAFDAPEAHRITLDTLQQLAPESWPGIQLTFHPSVQLFNSPSNAVNIWQALKQENPPPEVSSAEQCWLIWRNHERLTEFRHINDIEHLLLQQALTGDSFESLCETLTEHVVEDEAPQIAASTLMRWIKDGLIQSL